MIANVEHKAMETINAWGDSGDGVLRRLKRCGPSQDGQAHEGRAAGEPRTTKVRRPQLNGCVERFH